MAPSATPRRLAGYALLVLCFGLVVIAAVDVPFQLWQHGRDLKMTREEVREEYKESEGSPETRGRIREAQRALARGRMMQEVPKADVVVTNPTHFAVALRYDDQKMRAPDRGGQGRRPARRAHPRDRRRDMACRWSKRRRWRARCIAPWIWAAKCPPRCTSRSRRC